MGVSILLTILGQIYLILYNLPMKDFGKANFYSLYKNFYYHIIFFIIFSMIILYNKNLI